MKLEATSMEITGRSLQWDWPPGAGLVLRYFKVANHLTDLKQLTFSRGQLNVIYCIYWEKCLDEIHQKSTRWLQGSNWTKSKPSTEFTSMLQWRCKWGLWLEIAWKLASEGTEVKLGFWKWGTKQSNPTHKCNLKHATSAYHRYWTWIRNG